MPANRRPDGGVGLARAFKAALMAALLAAAGIGYVRQTMDQDRLGREVGEQEARVAELTAELQRQAAIRTRLTSPEAVQERVRYHRLNLATATPQQRIFVAVPAVAEGLAAQWPAQKPVMAGATSGPASILPTTLAQTGR